MIFSALLWLLVWGGMYTGPYNFTGEMLLDFFKFIQGARALLPLFALYLCFLWLILSKSRLSTVISPQGFFFGYGFIGIAISFFSPNIVSALYWGGVYLSPIFLVWLMISKENSIEILKTILKVNYFGAFLVLASLTPEILRRGLSSFGRDIMFELPFGLGGIRANGAGRFALIVLIVCFIRFISNKKMFRYMWLIPVLPAVLLVLQTQSRTALLGYALAGILFVIIKGIKWQFLIAGPVSAYIIYIAGYKWRAAENLNQLVDLTGREFTWQQALEMVKKSPLLGWGFHADRLLLESQHIHNSYIHALIHGGIVGLAFFVCAIMSIWVFLIKNGLIQKIKFSNEMEQPYLIESLLILGALTARSFFESTAAFFGVDLLFFLAAAAYIYAWGKKEMAEEGS